MEAHLKKIHGGYQNRAKLLRKKIAEVFEQCEEEEGRVAAFRNLQIGEEAAVGERLERLRAEAMGVGRREREAQEEYRGLLEVQ